ncbi:uncharacterized protein V1518DRAFT_408016 [Limtongia smithiae]|uniref:uncharacterized protein n=1 Tax=Limtongia smithiae TaxID=1125753 RepID=UPI0034CE6FB3
MSAPRSLAERLHPAPYVDPHSVACQVSFAQFADWRRQHTPPTLPPPDTALLRRDYDAYRRQLYARLARGFVVLHIRDQWFRERYDPVLRADADKDLRAYRAFCLADFLHELRAGVFDGFTLDSDRPRLLGPEHDAADDAPPDTKKVVLIKSVAPYIPRAKLLALARQIPSAVFISLSEPNQGRRFHRVAWVMLSADADLQKAVEALDGQIIYAGDGDAEADTELQHSEFRVHAGEHHFARAIKRRYLPAALSAPDTIATDSQRALRAARKLEKEIGMEGAVDEVRARAENFVNDKLRPEDVVAGGTQFKEEKSEDEDGMVDEEAERDRHRRLEISKKELDLTVLYLRQVYSFCYYCVTLCDSICDLGKKCPQGHLRRPVPTNPEEEKAFFERDQYTDNWIRSWTERYELFLDPTSLTSVALVRELGGCDVDAVVSYEINARVSKEDDSRFRCTVGTCTKLFKGADFVHKHIEKKHPEFVQAVRKEADMLNAYVADPCRLMPPRRDGSLPLLRDDMGKKVVAANAEEDGSPAVRAARAKMLSTFGGLPIAYPPPPPLPVPGSSGQPQFFVADPFNFGQSEGARGSNRRQERGSNDRDRGRNGDRGDRERNFRSRSPGSGRRPFPESRGDRDNRNSSNGGSRGDFYRGSGRHNNGENGKTRRAEEPRGRTLRSYGDLDTGEVKLRFY